MGKNCLYFFVRGPRKEMQMAGEAISSYNKTWQPWIRRKQVDIRRQLAHKMIVTFSTKIGKF